MGGRGGDPSSHCGRCSRAPVSPLLPSVGAGGPEGAHQEGRAGSPSPPGMNVGLGGGSPQGGGAAVWQLLFLERWADRTLGVPLALEAHSSESLAASLPGNRGRVGGRALEQLGWLCLPFQGPVPAGPAPAASLGGAGYASRQISFAGIPVRALCREGVSSPEWAQQMAPGPPPPRGGS